MRICQVSELFIELGNIILRLSALIFDLCMNKTQGHEVRRRKSLNDLNISDCNKNLKVLILKFIYNFCDVIRKPRD